MRAVDTCVLARWILRDDARKAAAADAMLAEPFFVGASVLVELGWVLRTVGGMDRTQLSRSMRRLLGLPTACVEHEAHVRWAVERFSSRGDLADLVHVAHSIEAGAFATFDQRLLGDAGPHSPVPIETVVC
jgi:predicted nucleic-acid-binding protein